MSHAYGSRIGNLLGACAVAVSDDVAGASPAGRAGAEALATLVHFGGTAPITALAEALDVTHSGAVRVVDRLVADGLVARGRREDDRRAVTLRLTPRGRRAARDMAAARARTLDAVLAPLDEAERVLLGELLERILAARAERSDAALRTCRRCDARLCGHPERCPVTVGTARGRAEQ